MMPVQSDITGQHAGPKMHSYAHTESNRLDDVEQLNARVLQEKGADNFHQKIYQASHLAHPPLNSFLTSTPHPVAHTPSPQVRLPHNGHKLVLIHRPVAVHVGL